MRLPVIALTALLLTSAPATAQTPPTQRAGTVRVVVHDLTNLPILGAEVTLTASDATTIKATTDDRGEARFEAIRAGGYSGRVMSAGFNPFELGEFSIRPGGRVTREVTLQVAGFFEEVDIAPGADDVS